MVDSDTPKTVPAKGSLDSQFLIVGEAPAAKEMQLGVPFVGPSGQVLDAALAQYPMGSYPDPMITNVIKYRLNVDKDPGLLQKLVQDNREAFLAEVREHPRRIILALGNVALWALTGDYSLKITKQRGHLIPSEFASIGIIAATHPAYLLRGNGSFRQFKSDVAYAISIAKGGSPHPYTPPLYRALTTKAEIDQLIRYAKTLPEGTIGASDLETTGFSHRMNRILSGGITFDGKVVYDFWGIKTGIPVDWNMLPYIKELYELPNIRYAWHNGKFDVKFLQTLGINARVDDDTMLMSYALDETRGIHDLEQVASDWLGSPTWKNILDQHKQKNQSYDVIPPAILEKYMAFDIANTWNLVPVMRPLIELDKGSNRLYHKTLIPASEYLADVETNGIFIDTAKVSQNVEVVGGPAAIYKAQILDYANKRSPGRYTDKLCNSPLQLAELLFDDIGLKTPERSTGDAVLDKLGTHVVVDLLRKYRKVHKQLSTYVKPYFPMVVDPVKGQDSGEVQDDGRVHCTFLIHGTATGRLSSRSPNLQNIPRDPLIKGQFIAPPGRVFIEPDLNQAELRSLACLSGDEALCAIYTDVNSKGLHEEVRKEIYGMPSDWTEAELLKYMKKWYVTDENRFNPQTGDDRILDEQKMKAKNVNFGIVYGITPFGLADQTGETPQEAKRMLDAWSKKFPQAWKFIQACRMAPLHGKNLVTVFGHKKRFQIVTEATLTEIQNEAANFPHQSMASTIVLHAGIRTFKKLREYDSFFVNTVHDSLIIEAPADPVIVHKVAELVKNEMSQVPVDWGVTRIPFLADAKFGTRWGSLGKQKGFYKEMGWDMPIAA